MFFNNVNYPLPPPTLSISPHINIIIMPLYYLSNTQSVISATHICTSMGPCTGSFSTYQEQYCYKKKNDPASTSSHQLSILSQIEMRSYVSLLYHAGNLTILILFFLCADNHSYYEFMSTISGHVQRHYFTLSFLTLTTEIFPPMFP